MLILITGASGMLGKYLSKAFPDAVLLKGKKDLDLTNKAEITKYLKDKHFDIIIHAAAFTDLKYCEKNPKKTRFIHSEIIDIFSQHCEKLIYISTNPLDSEKIYYLTKREGEIKTLLNNPRNLAIRTNIYGKGGLVEWANNELSNKENIYGYSEVYFNPVHVKQLSDIIKANLHLSGLVSVAGDISLSKYDFLRIMADFLNLDKHLIARKKDPKDDLTIQLKTSDFTCRLTEGLRYLKKDYE